MSKRVNEFTANYDGTEIRPDQVMVPFEYTGLDAENVKNPECIKTLTIAGQSIKVIYKAVPREFEKEGRSAFNLIQNEMLGHYAVPNSVSMDGVRDAYELEHAVVSGPEEEFMEKENLKEAIATFTELVKAVIDKSPKIGYSVLLLYTGVRGEEFGSRLKLTGNPANTARQKAAKILKDGLQKFDPNSFSCYKSRYDEYYRTEAEKLLNQITKELRF